MKQKDKNYRVIEEGLIEINPKFTAKVLAEMCYYNGINCSEYIELEENSKEALFEVIQEMSKLLVDIGRDYRSSRKTD